MMVKWQGLVRFRVSSEGELIGLAGALDMELDMKEREELEMTSKLCV